jgi:cob(I)alamin adenosyltransferase
VRYGKEKNNKFQANKLPYIRGFYRRAEREALRYGEMRNKMKRGCKRAVCRGVKRRAEKETVKGTEKGYT